MIINRIHGATRNMGAPKGWEEARDGVCVGLPIRDDKRENGGNVMISSWQPTPEEIEKLIAGAPVLLMVLGINHPPVHIDVGEPPK